MTNTYFYQTLQIAFVISIFFNISILHSRRHSIIIVDGYVAIFKIFAEFLGAAACVCHGLLEVDVYHTCLGLACILVGVSLKALLFHQQNRPKDRTLAAATYAVSGFYVVCVFASGLAFHAIIEKTGLLPCLVRLATCVVPLVALTDRFGSEGGGGPIGGRLTGATDAAAMVVLWWFCGHVSLKYFVVVPSVIGLLFKFIQYLMREVQKVASTEVVSDIYAT